MRTATETSPLRSATVRALFPALVTAELLLAVGLTEIDVAARTGLPRDLANALLIYPTFFGFWIVVALLERAFPYRPGWAPRPGDVRTDALHLVLSTSLSGAAFQASFALLFLAAGRWLGDALGATPWPVTWPAPLRLGLALLLAELGHYAFHRLSHENALVWRIHAVHHSPERLYWLNATRFHPLDLFSLTTLQMLPLLVLGADERTLVMYLIFTGTYGQLQHCNVEMPAGLLHSIFATPEQHRWHHSPDPREGNTNYGAVLNVWDRLFGTFFWPKNRAFHGTVGLDALPHFPRRWWPQMLSPFRWRVIQRDGAAPG